MGRLQLGAGLRAHTAEKFSERKKSQRATPKRARAPGRAVGGKPRATAARIGGDTVATREQVYAEQLRSLGVYQPAFEPEIKTLAELERDLQRAKKAWRATAPAGVPPSPLDPHYTVITNLRREILAHRDALGLTPKALRRLRERGTGDTPDERSAIVARLDAIAERVSGYDAAEISTE